jgi:hypothetical protein
VPDGLTIDPELRWIIVANLARLGRSQTTTSPPSSSGTTRSPGPSRRPVPGGSTDRGRQGRMAAGRRGGLDPQRNPERHLPQVLPTGPGRGPVPYLHRYFEAAERSRRRQDRGRAAECRCETTCCAYLFPWPVDKQPFLDELDDWLANLN